MTKKMTSKKREFSLSDTQMRRLKPNAKVSKISSASRIKNEEIVFKALWQCLVEKDIESFKEILRSHLEAVNKGQFAKKSKTDSSGSCKIGTEDFLR